MHFQLSQDQRDVVDAFERALARESTIERVRAAEKSGFDPTLWQVLVDMDALGVADPEGRGGAADVVVVAERAGRYLACVPLAEAVAAEVVLGSVEALGASRPVASAGPVVFCPRPAVGGRATTVSGGAAAEGLVVLDGPDLVLVRGGWVESVDDLGFTGAADWSTTGDGTERRVLARGDEARALWRHGLTWWRVTTAALCIGIAERSLEIAVEYATVREQFGAPIGSFQSIQHALAEVAVEVDGARLLVRSAAARHDAGEPAAEGAVTAAYASVCEVAVRAAEVGLHVHGGYGYTLEFDPQLYLRRAKALQLHGGDPEPLWETVGAVSLASDVEPTTDDERAAALRVEVRAFVERHVTPEVLARVADSGNYHDEELHRAVAERGWIGAHWAVEEGGRGWARSLSDVVYEELAAAGAPVEGLAITQIIGEAIRRVGTAEQKDRFLPAICRGEIVLALGYSEPASGSDLASVRTRAVREGDGWVIDGQKIFTTAGSIADHVFLLARTDPDAPKHAGLTLFLVPADDPGFSATPIFTLSGQRTNMTYYSNIRVDDSARLGAEGQGWEIVNVALAFERGGEFAAQLRRLVQAAARWARLRGRTDDPRLLARLGRAATSTETARLLGAYASWSRAAARAGAIEGTIAKVYGTEALQRESRTLLLGAGVEGLANDRAGGSAAAELQHLYRESQIATIYGGTSEVLKTVIAQSRLRLPRTPRPSR